MKAKAIFLLLMLTLISSMTTAQQPGKSVLSSLPEGTLVFRDMAYVTEGHERQVLDLYIPKTDEKLPLIIWIHGGAWMAGNKNFGIPFDYLTPVLDQIL